MQSCLNKPKSSVFLALREIARALGVSERTVRNYCERGLIPTAKRTHGNRGHWRVSARRPLTEAEPLWLWRLRRRAPRRSPKQLIREDVEEDLVPLLVANFKGVGLDDIIIDELWSGELPKSEWSEVQERLK